MRNRELIVDGTRIADDTDCWVIAEIGHNHQGSLEQCKELFAEAARCGAHAVKLQKRDNRALYTREAFNRPYENENSYGPTYGQHREALEFGRPEYQELKAYAAQIGVTFFATAFDFGSAEMLADLDMPAYKIASGDLTNTPLLRFVAEIGKPMILSTGGGTLDDVRRAHDCVAELNPQLALLQCTAGYPVENWDELDLRVIETYRQLFEDTVVGYSGHDNGIAMPVAAYVLGGRIVEKHFTLNRAMKGTDHRFSLEPVGLRKLVRDLQRTRLALGKGDKIPLSERGRSDHEDGQEDRRRAHAAGRAHARPRGPRAEVAGRRRPAAVRARRGDRPHAAPPGRRGRGLHVRRPRGADPGDADGCVRARGR